MPKVILTLTDTVGSAFSLQIESDPPLKDITREQAFASPSILSTMKIKELLLQRTAEAEQEEAAELASEIGEVADQVGDGSATTTA